MLFEAKAVVLATGGIGRAYKITSNSWEYTGDGHALAYDAGAELIDMEFVQFHPTGMVWPPSVRGHPGDRGRARRGRRAAQQRGRALHVRRHPATNYKEQTADNEEEGWRYCQGDKNARRPPELLTRDHVARCIVREVKEGRGSPHGGVFLDISWIKEQIPNAAEHIKRKLPSMYHQFKQLADIDITKEPMEVGPDHALHDGRRAGRRRDADVDACPASSPPASAAPGINGANRLGGNSLSDLLVFGKRAGEYAAAFASEQGAGRDRRGAGGRRRPSSCSPRSSAMASREPRRRTRSSTTCRTMMQDLVGIVRSEDGDGAGPGGASAASGSGRRRVGVVGNREYNPGWHTALDLHNLLTVSEAITRAALERKESRGAQFRDDYPEKDPAFGEVNIVVRKEADGEMQISPRADRPDARRACRQIIEEMK